MKRAICVFGPSCLGVATLMVRSQLRLLGLLRLWLGLGVFVAAACSGAGSGRDDAGARDVGPADSGGTSQDAGTDAGPVDAGGTDAGDADAGPGPGALCPSLPPPAAGATVIDVDSSQVDQLRTIVAGAPAGATIRFADGHYDLKGAYLWITAPGLTLRSASGHREAVILDGNDQTTEIITVAASNVTLADLTLQHAHTHAIHVVTAGSGPPTDTLGARIYNVHIIDSREQAIKVNPNQAGSYVDDGEVACSHIELTDAGRPNVQPNPGGCYTGGFDGHQAQGWWLHDNRIEGFWCNTGIAEHAIHCWRGCRDTLVERNLLLNNARGVGFGLATSGAARSYADNPCPEAQGGYVGHYGGIVRNNVIFADDAGLLASPDGFDCGICMWSACGASALHNTVASTGSNFSSIEWRFATSVGVKVMNNLVTHPLRGRNGAVATEAGNLGSAPLSLFADTGAGNLHLNPGAAALATVVDQGVSLPAGLCDSDLDGETRDAKPDIGADELKP